MQISRQQLTSYPISATGWRYIESKVCKEISLDLKFNSDIFSINNGVNSFKT